MCLLCRCLCTDFSSSCMCIFHVVRLRSLSLNLHIKLHWTELSGNTHFTLISRPCLEVVQAPIGNRPTVRKYGAGLTWTCRMDRSHRREVEKECCAVSISWWTPTFPPSWTWLWSSRGACWTETSAVSPAHPAPCKRQHRTYYCYHSSSSTTSCYNYLCCH